MKERYLNIPAVKLSRKGNFLYFQLFTNYQKKKLFDIFSHQITSQKGNLIFLAIKIFSTKGMFDIYNHQNISQKENLYKII